MLAPSERWIVSSPDRKIKSSFGELWKSRAILFALVKRDLKSRYRTSFFGFAWAFAKPLMQLAVYVLVIGSVLGASKSISNFAIYIFVGLMFWNFFAESVTSGAFSVIASAGLVTKISFPREILPISVVAISGVNLLIQMPVLIAGYIWIGASPNFQQFIYLIPILISLILLAISSALILSALNVYARDIQPLSELFIMLLMYLCPLIYSWTFVSDVIRSRFGESLLMEIYKANPLSQIFTGIQDVLWNGDRIFSSGSVAPDFMGSSLSSLWIGTAISFLILIVSYKLFLKLEPNFAREL